MNHEVLAILLIVISSISTVACENQSTDPQNEFKNEHNESLKAPQYSYDILQTFFLSIGENTTIEDVEKFVSDNGLEYTLEHYNSGEKTYNLAYTKGASLQSYADPGDHIEISFDEEEPCKIRVAQYVQDGKAGYSAVYYNHGTFWDFSDSDKMDGNYTGYYISDSFGNDKGIIIKYTNGNEANTNYFKFETAEETIQQIIDYKE